VRDDREHLPLTVQPTTLSGTLQVKESGITERSGDAGGHLVGIAAKSSTC
jgi:hypothetical protein